MSEQNKDVSYLNLLKKLEEQNTKIPIAQQQDQDLGFGLGLGLSLGKSYNPPTRESHTQPETAFLVRDFTLNGNLINDSEEQNTKLPIAHQQDQDLGLGFRLSLGKSYTRPTSDSHPQPETAVLVRKFTPNGKPYKANYSHVNDHNSSGYQQPARVVHVPLPPYVEAEMNKPKETKAIIRIEAKKRSMLKKSSMDMQRQLENDEGGKEGWHSVKTRKIEGRSGDWEAESTTKNTAYLRSVEKLNFTHAGMIPHVTRSAIAYDHPEANRLVLESGNSANYPYENAYVNRNTLTQCTCRARGINASMGRNRDKRPMICRGMGKVERAPVLESSNVKWNASANYHPETNQEISSTHYPYENPYGNRDILTRCTCHTRNVATLMGRNPGKMPMVRGSENPPDKAKLMSQKPRVTAMGPTGEKLEGFLFKYGTGYVTIVCLCHYQYLSPDDFVRHAGWADVANPMQHIKVLAPGL